MISCPIPSPRTCKAWPLTPFTSTTPASETKVSALLTLLFWSHLLWYGMPKPPPHPPKIHPICTPAPMPWARSVAQPPLYNDTGIRLGSLKSYLPSSFPRRSLSLLLGMTSGCFMYHGLGTSALTNGIFFCWYWVCFTFVTSSINARKSKQSGLNCCTSWSYFLSLRLFLS